MHQLWIRLFPIWQSSCTEEVYVKEFSIENLITNKDEKVLNMISAGCNLQRRLEED